MTPRVVLTSFLLLISSLSVFAYKNLKLGIPASPQVEARVWNIEARLDFETSRSFAELKFIVPERIPGYEIENETFYSAGFGLATVYQKNQRQIRWSGKSKPGSREFVYRATVRRSHSQVDILEDTVRLEDITISDARVKLVKQYLRTTESDPTNPRSLAREILELTSNRPSESLAEKIFSWRKTTRGRLFLASQMLSLANIPSRVAHGLKLDKPRRVARIQHWLEVYDGEEWVRFSEDGRRLKSLRNNLAWWYGRAPLTEEKGGELKELLFSSNVNELYVLSRSRSELDAVHGKSWYLPLLYLSTDMQALFRVMLLIPFGALIICFIRNIIGVQTFGTFMPVLIALSFRDTQLLWGAVLFTFAVSIGLAARFLLSKFRLLMVPRLAAMLTVVVLLLLLAAVLMSEYQIEQGLSIALFPLVIMTMTIERMSILWEEIGPRAAIKRGFGTLIAAVLVYLCIFPPEVQYLFFVFPETILSILALILLIGRYTGYRVTELMRFRELLKSA